MATTQDLQKAKRNLHHTEDNMSDKSKEISEQVQRREADTKYELHKNQAKNPNAPVAERIGAGMKMAEDAVAGQIHKAGEKYYAAPPASEVAQNLKEQAKIKTEEITEDLKFDPRPTLGSQIKNKANEMAAASKIQEADSKYELHKDVAMDPTVPIPNRIGAGVKMVEDGLAGGYHRAAEQYYAAPTVAETAETVKNKTSEIAENIKGTPVSNAQNRLDANMKIKEADSEYEIQKSQANNPNLPVLDRIVAGTHMTEAAIQGGFQRVAEKYYAAPPVSEQVENLTEAIKSKTNEIVENLKDDTPEPGTVRVTDKTNEVLESMKAREADASYYQHKNEANDPNLPVLDRIAAGTKMVEDAVTGSFHRAAESFYKM